MSDMTNLERVHLRAAGFNPEQIEQSERLVGLSIPHHIVMQRLRQWIADRPVDPGGDGRESARAEGA